jgi:hypothetical protein
VTLRSGLLLAALAIATGVLVSVRPGTPPGRASRSEARVPVRSTDVPGSSAGPALDPATIRDLFRFAPQTAARPERPAVRAAPAAAAASPAPGSPRLVGLVRRQGRLLAAFAIGGDVVLAGPGEAAGELTVLAVSEDGVRIRRRDGGEELLALP